MVNRSDAESQTSLGEALRGVFITIAIVGGIFYLLANALSGTTSDEADTGSNVSIPKKWATWDEEEEIPEAYVLVVSKEAVRENYLPTMGNIYGYARNRMDKNLSYIQIDYGIYNENGSKVGNCVANQTNLPANTTWEFSAICTDLPTTAFKYRVDDVSYW